MNEDQWLNAIDEGDLDGFMEKKRKREERKEAKKAKRDAELAERRANGEEIDEEEANAAVSDDPFSDGEDPM